MRNIVENARKIMARYKAAAVSMDDAVAVTVPELFSKWKSGAEYAVGDRVRYGEKLYKCISAHTTQADWTPDATPALWVVIDVAHAGTIDDPIPASRGMEYTYGLYYLDPEDGNLYLCKRGSETGTIVLHYLPHELVGQYFEAVS